ncbi:hypothetical protein XBO1_1800038 [Xenorhabdus bovienii str. oregonense]|uniref:Transposase n=1 Tax=Xenorhabdus bovienii str. oregonense TaxID=1398202 RepID=A0A077P3Q7_XENBV|nr:hypothetical protein XBO1_1800038 [Xenorhabdus bovienii str. oregonense]
MTIIWLLFDLAMLMRRNPRPNWSRVYGEIAKHHNLSLSIR